MMFMAKAITAFLVPAVVSGITGVISGAGITGDMTVKTALTMFATGVLTYLVPNKKT